MSKKSLFECVACHQLLARTQFYKRSDRPKGIASICKDCDRKRRADWGARNREYISRRNAEYRRENREQILEQKRKHYWDNRDRLAAEHREWYFSNRDREVQKKRQFYTDNRDPCLRMKHESYVRTKPQVYLRRHVEKQRRRSVLAQCSGSYTVSEWTQLLDYFGHQCLCCGSDQRISADHVIPLSCGGSNDLDNIQPLCVKCNASKGKKIIDYRSAYAINAA